MMDTDKPMDQIYRKLVELSSDGFWLLDSEFRTLYVNPAMEEMLGYSLDEMFGRSWYDFGDPEWVVRAQELERRREQGVKEPHRFLFLHKSGRKVLTRIATSPLYNDEGGFDGAIGVLSDITTQKETEEAIRIRDILNTIAKSAGIGICLLNPDYTIEWYNDLHAKWHGPLGAAKGRNCFEVFTGEKIICKGCPCREAFETGIAAEAEFSGVTTAEGPDKTMKLIATPILDSNGDVVQMVEIVQDITDRKQIEERFRSTAVYARTLIEASIDPLVTINAEGKITDVNNATVKAIGMPRESLINTDFADYFTDPEKASQGYLRVFSEGEVHDYPLSMKNSSGEVMDVLYSATIYKNEAGEVQGVFAAARDVTKRMEAERLLKRSLREKDVLLKEIHHRVKNNMQVIYSLLSLQARGIPDSSVRAMFEESRNRINSMSLIHENLYKSEDLAHIDYKKYLKKLVGSIADSYKRPDVSLCIEMEPTVLDVNIGIPCGLIVNELVSNSLKYAFPDERKGTITVGINRTNENRYLLAVTDNGIGFPADLDFRNTKSLGMQLVTILTGQINGTIEMNTDEGTAFSITFPAH